MILMSCPSPLHWQVQHTIGATNAIAFDLTAACSGFVVGAGHGARSSSALGWQKTFLVIGADALSRYIDWRDRGEWCWMQG